MFKRQLGALVLGIASACAVQATELSDPTIHGTYIGFNPLAAIRGVSYADSTLRFTVSSGGIALLTPIASGARVYTFTTMFPREWVFHMKGWGVDECLAIRQHATSQLAQLLFCFSPKGRGIEQDVTMILGEGMPMTLGVFVHEARGTTPLLSMYQKAYQPAVPKQEIAWLTPVDVPAGKVTMTSGTREAKVALLHNAEINLWTASESVIKDRLALVKMGLRDKDPEVQKAALRTFTLGGRVTDGVAIVSDFLRGHKSLRADVLVEALTAAACLLYETNQQNGQLAALINTFGTSDVGVIHRQTRGNITPEQSKLLEQIARPTPLSRTWTREQQSTLLDAVSKVMADPSVIGRAREEGESALREYPLRPIRR